MVRYLYIIYDRILCTMQGAKRTIMQDMQFHRKSEKIMSSVSVAECYVCGRGLEDGFSISAKTLPSGTVLFCNVHYSLQ